MARMAPYLASVLALHLMANDDSDSRVSEALAKKFQVAGVEPLSTLDHSFVARVRLADESTVVFKQAGADLFAGGMRKEIVVNRDVLSQLQTAIAPRMLDCDLAADRPWMVFEDLSSTHETRSLATPPPLAQIRAFVQTLARVHALTSSMDLEALFKGVQGDVGVTDGSEHVPEVLEAFLASQEIASFPASVRRLVEQLRDQMSTLAERLEAGDAVLLHGDAHFGNAMYRTSRDGNPEALLLDWALAVIGPGGVDLAHALAMNLPRLHGGEYEMALLREYGKVCSEHGYARSEDALYFDYRLGLLLGVLVSIGMKQVPGVTTTVWSYVFTNAAHAALQHDAAQLLR